MFSLNHEYGDSSSWKIGKKCLCSVSTNVWLLFVKFTVSYVSTYEKMYLDASLVVVVADALLPSCPLFCFHFFYHLLGWPERSIVRVSMKFRRAQVCQPTSTKDESFLNFGCCFAETVFSNILRLKSFWRIKALKHLMWRCGIPSKVVRFSAVVASLLCRQALLLSGVMTQQCISVMTQQGIRL